MSTCLQCAHPEVHHGPTCVWRTATVCGCPKFKERPKASVYAQQNYQDDSWVWWITSTGNHVTLAKSPKSYATERAAIKAAQAVAALGEIEIDERNLR